MVYTTNLNWWVSWISGCHQHNTPLSPNWPASLLQRHRFALLLEDLPSSAFGRKPHKALVQHHHPWLGGSPALVSLGGVKGLSTGVPGVKPPNLSPNAGTHLYGSKYVRLMWRSPHPPLFSTPVGISKAWWLKQPYTWEHATKREVCSIKMFYVLACCLSCISSRFLTELSIQKMQ